MAREHESPPDTMLARRASRYAAAGPSGCMLYLAAAATALSNASGSWQDMPLVVTVPVHHGRGNDRSRGEE